MYLRKKISTKNIEKLLAPHATDEKILVVHSEDIDYKKFFPNAYTVTKRRNVEADQYVDKYYDDLTDFDPNSYDVIICTGLLEHVPEPKKLINSLKNILKPGGKLVMQASSAFSVHEAPDDFFHFTQYGFKYLFSDWKSVTVTGSCKPFETISILLQRIAYQAQMNIFMKFITVALYNIILLMDGFIGKQYGSMKRNESTEIDSLLPSNVQAVAFK